MAGAKSIDLKVKPNGEITMWGKIRRGLILGQSRDSSRYAIEEVSYDGSIYKKFNLTKQEIQAIVVSLRVLNPSISFLRLHYAN